MTTFYADSVAGLDTNPGTNAQPVQTIAKAISLCAANHGDQVILNGLFSEAISVDKAGLSLIANASSPTRPAVDGGGTLQTGVTTAQVGHMKNLLLRGFEIRHFYKAGVDIGGGANDPSTLFGTFGVVIEDLDVHHIIDWTVGSPAINGGDSTYQNGITVTCGDPIVRNCSVRHIGQGSEAHGIFLSWCKDFIVDGNEVYGVRKEAIRWPYCWGGRVTNNRAWLSTYGINAENTVAGLVANNYCYMCAAPFVGKHDNNPGLAQPLFSKFNLVRKPDENGRMAVYYEPPSGGSFKQPETRFWHNTAYGSRLYHWYIANGLSSASHPDKLFNYQSRNNFFAGPGPMYLFDSLVTLNGVTDVNRDDTVTFDWDVFSNLAGSAPLYSNDSTPGGVIVPTLQELAAATRTLGWEANGRMLPVTVADPLSGNPATTQPIAPGLDLTGQGSDWGDQIGAVLPSSSTRRWQPSVIRIDSATTVKPQSNYDRVTDEQSITGFSADTGVNESLIIDQGSSKTFRYILWDPQPVDDADVCNFTVSMSDNPAGPWTQIYSNHFPDGGTSRHVIELDQDPSQTYTARYVKFTGVDTRGDFLVSLGEPAFNKVTAPKGHLVNKPFFFREIGVGQILSSEVIPPENSPPVNTILPLITSPSPAHTGQTCSCSSGTWLNNPNLFAYQWLRDGVDIPGATQPTHTFVAADEGFTITCRVTASNAAGGTPANSSNGIIPTAPAPPGSAPVNTVLPVITSPDIFVGTTASCDTGQWNNNPLSFTRQWKKDSTDISGETGQTYVYRVGDVGHSITCTVVATNGSGSTPVTSAPVHPEPFPVVVLENPLHDPEWGLMEKIV